MMENNTFESVILRGCFGSYAISHYLSKAGERILRTWTAPSPFLPDFLPTIGWVPENDKLFIACNFQLSIKTIPLLAPKKTKFQINPNNVDSNNLLKPYSCKQYFIEPQLVGF